MHVRLSEKRTQKVHDYCLYPGALHPKPRLLLQFSVHYAVKPMPTSNLIYNPLASFSTVSFVLLSACPLLCPVSKSVRHHERSPKTSTYSPLFLAACQLMYALQISCLIQSRTKLSSKSHLANFLQAHRVVGRIDHVLDQPIRVICLVDGESEV
jgi:hypothetical protein